MQMQTHQRSPGFNLCDIRCGEVIHSLRLIHTMSECMYVYNVYGLFFKTGHYIYGFHVTMLITHSFF